MEEYLKTTLGGESLWLPEEPFIGRLDAKHEAVEWALVWRTDGAVPVSER